VCSLSEFAGTPALLRRKTSQSGRPSVTNPFSTAVVLGTAAVGHASEK
jgi:hypothetical protein